VSLLEFSLLNGCQRDFPLVERPYLAVAAGFGLEEAALLSLLRGLAADGRLGRVGAVFAPGRIGASTLAALRVPPVALERVGALVTACDEVNHNYEREHEFNLWFVAAAPDEERLDQVLSRIERQSECPLISLPLVEEYRIDLGFDLAREGTPGPRPRSLLTERLRLTDEQRAIVRALQAGLPLVPLPFAALAQEAGTTTQRVLATLQGWVQDGTIRRFGLIVRHRELGFVANAMAVWDVADDCVSAIGHRLAQERGVTLAYRRQRCPPNWPYNLFCMIHGRERAAVAARIAQISAELDLRGSPHAVLFSRRRFKQTGPRHLETSTVAAHG
jgi:DNA-binding Lrp family transcriptional regulator